ncbi:acyltransferase [Craurococcus roseus]|uniref:Acyltransferase n=1 Tax=Craurococcus roseus TaxID=77585 RepID=A0ABP3QMY6_9PROT
MNEIRSLTALRGVAALWVFGFHLWLLDHASPAPAYDGTPAATLFEHGWTGVDLFFILSGYILATVHPGLSAAGTSRFLVRRAFRLYPLHVATTLALAAGVALASAAGMELSRDGRYSWDDLPASLLLLHTFFSEPNRWNSVTWSISVELVCYALLPAVLPVMRRVPRRGLVAAAFALGAAAAVWIVALDAPSHGWPALVRGLFGFYLGCCVALASAGPGGEAGSRFGRHAGAWALAAAAVLAFGVVADLPSLVPPCTAVLVGALAAERGMMARALNAEPLVWLGRVSFSIYLLHMPVLAVLERLMPLHKLPLSPLGGALLRDAVALAVVLAASALAYRLVEEPGRRLPSRLGLLAPRPTPA